MVLTRQRWEEQGLMVQELLSGVLQIVPERWGQLGVWSSPLSLMNWSWGFSDGSFSLSSGWGLWFMMCDAGKISSHHEKQYFSPLFSWSGHLKHADEDISARPEARGACSAWEPYLTQAVSFSWIHLCSAFLTLIWSCGVSYACLCVLEALATLNTNFVFYLSPIGLWAA